jgi:fructose-specific phosphotransferase system IIC component
MIEEIKKLRQHLLTGVSFAIPFIACGGILIALGICTAIENECKKDKTGLHRRVLTSLIDSGCEICTEKK